MSEIIEKVSGKPYEQFMKEDVFAPAGCYDMHIAGTYYKDKRDNEVRYYTHEGDGKYIEEYNDSGVMVERCYGGNNIPLLSGAGAWCGSTLEIARLVACIDGQDEIPDIISKEAVRQNQPNRRSGFARYQVELADLEFAVSALLLLRWYKIHLSLT